ncbi:MAG: methyltransferase domain-containing protein [Pseudolabrys sp.]|nr:methyltransferase domain-containing protein [Pseudolabrys sp.]
MSSFSTLRVLAQSLRRPQPMPGDRGCLRTIVSRPIIFDLVSTVMQLRDLSRLKKIEKKPEYVDQHYDHVHEYNAGVTTSKIVTRTRRAERLLPILGFPPRDLSQERILLIGPRNIHEILQVWLIGYRWKNIDAIDLYATTPKIQIMNMESMTFPDQTFDAIFASATLSYAKDVKQCVREYIRVLKIGGRAAFTQTHILADTPFHGNAIPGEEVVAAISRAGGEIYYHNVLEKKTSHSHSARIHELGVVRRA